MADDCIALRRSLASDPRTLRISAALKLDPATIVGTLHALGVYSALYGTTDGDESAPDTINRRFIPLDASMLDTLLGVEGLAAQLEAVEWMTVAADGITIDGDGWCEFALSHHTWGAR